MIIDRRKLKKEFKKSFSILLSKQNYYNDFKYFLICTLKTNSIKHNPLVVCYVPNINIIYKSKTYSDGEYGFISSTFTYKGKNKC